jgi:hypothetical protein
VALVLGRPLSIGGGVSEQATPSNGVSLSFGAQATVYGALGQLTVGIDPVTKIQSVSGGLGGLGGGQFNAVGWSAEACAHIMPDSPFWSKPWF